ncbi:hypothetical protein ACFVHQ_02435 [Actinomycetes bacterium NPDC127524]
MTHLIIASFKMNQGFNEGNNPGNPMIAPKGIAFSIWFLIFICLLIWCVRPLRNHREDQELVKSIGLWFPVCIFFTGTSVLVGEPFSILFIVLGLLTLMLIYTRITKSPGHSKWMKFPFSIFIGWLSLATVVDAFVVIQSQGITTLFGLAEQAWTNIILTATIIIGISFTYFHKDWIFATVFCWSYFWIIFNGETRFPQQFIAGLGILLLATAIIIIIRNKHFKKALS